MVSGWAVPVRVGNKVLAVLEFYCHFVCAKTARPWRGGDGGRFAGTDAGALPRTRPRRGTFRQQEILLDSVADGICGVDRHGLVSFANPAAARLLGAAPPASPANRPRTAARLAPRPPVRRRLPLLRRASGLHLAAAGEDTIFRADGSFLPGRILPHPHSRSGPVLRLRAQLPRHQPALCLDRLKDEFISTVSHELRTPLTSIRGALGLLSSGMLGE
jgi:signal transduction histidine kinase